MPTENPINKQAAESNALANELHKQFYGDRDTDNPAPDAIEKDPSMNGDTPEAMVSEPQTNDGFEQRYLSLQGKFNTEVPRLSATVKYLEDERINLQGQVARLQQDLANSRNSPVENKQEHQGDASQYFGDFDEGIGTGVKNAIDDAVKPLQEKIAKNEQAEAETNQHNDAINTVVQMVGGSDAFTKIDSNAEFTAWLNEGMSPLDQRPKRHVMMDALSRGDLSNVANFYITWADSQQPEPSAPTVDLNEQLQPDTTRATSTPQAGKTYSRADIAAFYKDKTMGKYKGQEAEARSIEMDIIAAQSEGRIVG